VTAKATSAGAAAPKSAARKALVRGEPVVTDVLDATVTELSHVGYRALRIENVAARAGVHKTTIYRRWPEKIDLVAEALLRNFDQAFEAPDTGSLRDDLLAVATHMRKSICSPGGASAVRLLMAEHNDKDVRRIVDILRKSKEDIPRQLVRRAASRGELREGVDGDLLIGMLAGTIQHLAFALDKVPSDGDLEAVVDMLAYGAIRRDR
jgi:AcrR family transcriptional regulator